MNIALCGLGKAGKVFVEDTLHSSKYELKDVLCRESSNTAGQTVTEVTSIKTKEDIIISKLSEFDNKNNIDVIIDFSSSETTMHLVDICCKYGINLVICPTNFTQAQLNRIKGLAEDNDIGVLFAPTLTIGINMLMDFVEKLSGLFLDFSFEIIEKHPTNKGAPTMTAKKIAGKIDRSNVPISSIRLDGYVGEHEVIATNGCERISITHESFSRSAFVKGSLFAADYIAPKKGFYEINDVFTEIIKAEYGV